MSNNEIIGDIPASYTYLFVREAILLWFRSELLQDLMINIWLVLIGIHYYLNDS